MFNVQPWCSTGEVYDGLNWGWCDPDCVLHEDTFSWRKDKKIKMTLHYHTTDALWAGLKWYLWSLLPISFLGLLFTTIMPILGIVMVQSVFPIIVSIIQS